MQTRTKFVAATAALAITCLGVGATVASAASSGSNSPAAQPTATYVFACVNKSGKIDYLEFRKPLPHQCWFSGETLWYWGVQPSASPLASATATPSPGSSASTAPSPSVSPSPTPSATASGTASATTTTPAAGGSAFLGARSTVRNRLFRNTI